MISGRIAEILREKDKTIKLARVPLITELKLDFNMTLTVVCNFTHAVYFYTQDKKRIDLSFIKLQFLFKISHLIFVYLNRFNLKFKITEIFLLILKIHKICMNIKV